MANEIIPYVEMCRPDGVSLQRCMNFELRDNHSVIPMSLRPCAPYADKLEDDGATLIYEGHDVPKSAQNPNPKLIDQPERNDNGSLTENGKCHKAAHGYKRGNRPPERVRVCDKIKAGTWSYNGVSHLDDSWREKANGRRVFRFNPTAIERQNDFSIPVPKQSQSRPIIPTWAKLEVWRLDDGKCAKRGSTQDLHFDRIIPYSNGGASNTPKNIQPLCGRHNIQKHDRIE